LNNPITVSASARCRTSPGAADRRLDAGLGQSLRVPDRQVLHAPIAVMHQRLRREDGAIVERLLQRIESQVATQRRRRPPADDPTRKHVDDERHVHEPSPLATYVRSATHS
jgi:hypothetical protein